MSELLRKWHEPGPDGLVHRVTPADAGWVHVGFELYRLEPGQSLTRSTGEREACLVLIGGRADVSAGGQSWQGIGERAGPFEDESPYAVYVPFHDAWKVTATSSLELAVCTAPGGGDHGARLITPSDVAFSSRGTGSNVRHVRDILPEGKPAHSLLVVEVVTPGGNWSSYPPHKHDVDDPPGETLLEETYYHRLNPSHGFALQRVYTDDRSLDVAMAVEDGDVTLVPKGYHPCAAAHGYDLYYLNVMAGPKRSWHFNTEPAHRWLLRR
ncbi:MAG TPA: 5-deoxy-glucuronate isomerase [Geminicoccus sp.]|jgi:5-deoxy-glucuronate isomerase|uniref:5-deoxy-glucuronate isomerase n=1 Tax=Geminicoccus sp. TaxID=2024832 RepID=UPI002E319942|nr:5-deoxy-glucuronate isomerase [Geminicoccus sp.]HEX2528854.1 5-deoxy-glucuronate isomerase [Geminicoccus sp.]